MRRVTEKVKDIVEVRPFTHLHDFAADPDQTLAAYHFTDITADLMGKWLDRVANVRAGQGSAYALAGLRGVGKSHFISVLSAVVSRPELRGRIPDQHVAASANRLPKRPGVVVIVRRGTGKSLLDELKHGVADLIGLSPSSLNDSLHDLLLGAYGKTGDAPLLILIDTALGREARVARDDGPYLSEIAETARKLGIFVGVALDDDISGADGPNLSITSSFSIDYLDQEHLYNIVDSHIFSKHDHKRPLLRGIYEDFRVAMPGFRWSEQRFLSLYPLHPATLEIAPLVRLYLPDFGLLGFAAEAGLRIMGRPANSLIGLDEVFDSVEQKLRAVPYLQDAFVTFDHLEQELVAKTPVHLRLPAKLLLKGLLLLSLKGQGSTAAEIAASMMIFDGEAGSPSIDVCSVLESFTSALPGSVDKTGPEDDPRFSIRLAPQNAANEVLECLLSELPAEALWQVLFRHTAEKFSDVEVTPDFGTYPTHCSLEWRGSIRRGEIVWNWDQQIESTAASRDSIDWRILVMRGGEVVRPADDLTLTSAGWRLGEISSEEREAIGRYHLLQNDESLRARYGDGLATAIQVQTVAVERIWQRIFLHDSRLIVGDTEHVFSEEAKTAHSLSQLFSLMLAPTFEDRYVFHPQFPEPLGMKQAADLIARFFGGSEADSSDVQRLAEAFAVPLGLAERVDGQYVPVPATTLLDHPEITAAFPVPCESGGELIPLTDISRALKAEPYGLTREAQHLILAALVAQRQFEFVTMNGNRINNRSLDLQIIWDDIEGVAPPLDEMYTSDSLLAWARLITGSAGLKSIKTAADRQLVADALAAWLAAWKDKQVLHEFDDLPEEYLNASVWRRAGNLRKTLGAMADTIEALVAGESSLEQCLQSIATVFSDSEAEFRRNENEMHILQEFTTGVSDREELIRYLTASEITDSPDIEKTRLRLLEAVDLRTNHAMSPDDFKELSASYKNLYAAYFADLHDALMLAESPAEHLKQILMSESWGRFQTLEQMGRIPIELTYKVDRLVREMRQAYCESNVRATLETKPYCHCAFSLRDAARLQTLAEQLKSLLAGVSESFKKSITGNDPSRANVDDRQVLDNCPAAEANGEELVVALPIAVPEFANTEA